METPVEIQERETENGKRIGVATLTRERALNSLTLETIDLLGGAIYRWLADEDVVCIVLTSASDRAFSAGADIQALYREIQENGVDNAYGRNFFTREYRLDHTIATTSKPILVWGHGLVIGGGFGLLAGCSHRVGTATTRLAMPEITIGLFPDAGGTWHLSHLRGRAGLSLGHFMGLSGCQISATDGKVLGLLDFLIDDARRVDILEGLTSIPWSGTPDTDRAVLTAYLKESPGQLAESDPDLIRFADPVEGLIRSCLDEDEGFFSHFSSRLDDLPDDPWLNQAVSNYRNGSPLTARIFIEQMRRGETMSMAETLRMELAIAWQCLRHDEFPEGVRALMIDKDRNPKWGHPDPMQVPDGVVARHFEPCWSGSHPLDLS